MDVLRDWDWYSDITSAVYFYLQSSYGGCVERLNVDVLRDWGRVFTGRSPSHSQSSVAPAVGGRTPPVFANICDDLRLRVCWVGVSGVCECAGDSDFADCLQFVCIADDVADKGVVWRQEAVVVEWRTCEDRFVFRAV